MDLRPQQVEGPNAVSDSPILVINDVSKTFRIRSGFFGGNLSLTAVKSASLTVWAGEIVAVIGESGCGKSTLGRLITTEISPNGGTVEFSGTDAGEFALRERAKFVQPVPQDPKGALDPRWKIGRILSEPIRIHGLVPEARIGEMVDDMLDQVGLKSNMAEKFPRDLSGGEAQRVVIARAIALSPKVLVCDEAVSALDAAVQVDIIKLLLSVRDSTRTALVFISHDLAMVNRISDRVMIMYLGEILEIVPASRLGHEAGHPYSSALIKAAPRYGRAPDAGPRATLKGEVPSPIDRPGGCVFHPRCPIADSVCRTTEPRFVTVSEGHLVKCHFAEAARGDDDNTLVSS